MLRKHKKFQVRVIDMVETVISQGIETLTEVTEVESLIVNRMLRHAGGKFGTSDGWTRMDLVGFVGG